VAFTEVTEVTDVADLAAADTTARWSKLPTRLDTLRPQQHPPPADEGPRPTSPRQDNAHAWHHYPRHSRHRLEERPDPTIVKPTDAVVRTVAACVCGSDLWRYRGIQQVPSPTPIGHEYVGVVEAVGDDVSTVAPGQFVVGGFLTSDNTCPLCKAGAHANCLNVTGYDGCQAELIRVQNADGTLLATAEQPDDGVVPSVLALSDVMCTGWHAAVSAEVRPGSTVVVVGDGAVGLSGVLAASQLGAERVIAMSRHADRQALAREFGATDIVAERGDKGVEAVQALTGGIGADAVLECVGTHESVIQALRSARPGGMVGWVGVPHVGEIPQEHMFWRNVGLRGGPAPVRAYLPDLLERVLDGRIEPGKVFDLTLPLDKVAEAYAAMDERRSIKTLLRP
jgi:threonine dehydrogenase-like Zn-dependent dehydrogenase